MTYSNLQIFTVELIGTFILVVFATGSIVYDAEFLDGQLGIPLLLCLPEGPPWLVPRGRIFDF